MARPDAVNKARSRGAIQGQTTSRTQASLRDVGVPMRFSSVMQYLVPLAYLVPAVIAFWIGFSVRGIYRPRDSKIDYARIVFYLCMAEGVHNSYYFVATSARIVDRKTYKLMMLPLPWLLAQGVITLVFLMIAAYFFREKQGEIRDLGRIRELARKYRELAYVDPLTALNNRRSMGEVLDQEKIASSKMRKPFSIMMIDLDHFKRYNDTRGHQKGDQMLVAVSGAMQASVRHEVDTPFRYGGDEFLILLRGTGLGEARRIGERLNESVRDLSNGEISLSIGILEVSPGDRMTAEEIVRGADTLMYAAKRLGGNQVVASAHSGPTASAILATGSRSGAAKVDGVRTSAGRSFENRGAT